MDSDTPSVAARLDRMPLTGFHGGLGIILALGLLVDGVDVYMTAGVSGALMRRDIASLDQVSHLAMATTFGLMGGGFFAGALADRFGRRRAMQATMVLVIIGGLLAASAPSFETLLAWRAVTTLGLGGETILAYGMLTEFIPMRARGRAMATVALLGAFGLPLCLSLGHWILPAPEGWRIMLAIPAAAGVVILLLRLLLPESPRWLATRNRAVEASAIVARIEASTRRPLPPVSEPASIVAPRQSGLWRRLSAAAAIHIATMGAVFGFVSWLPTFFAATGQSIASSTLFAGVMAFGAPVGTMIAFVITDRIERKWGVVIAALVASLLGVAYALATTSNAILWLGFLMVVSIYVFATLGLFSYVPELFATDIRLFAIGLTSTIGRAAAFLMPLAVAPVFTNWGQPGVVLMIVALLLAQAGLVAWLGVRTKGRSLEQI